MFLKRLRKSYQFNFKLLKSVIDWTIVLYIMMPALIISYFLIRDYVQHAIPLHISPTFFSISFLIASLFFCKTSLRLFLYDADILFYKQLRNLDVLKLQAYLYNIVVYNGLVVTALFFVSLFVTFPLIESMLWLNILSAYQLIVRYRAPRWYIQIPILLTGHALGAFFITIFPLWGTVILFALSQFLVLKLVRSNRYWSTEIKWEYEAFYKWMHRIYMLSKEMRYYLPTKNKKPLFLLAKKRTLSKYRLDNFVYKTLLRSYPLVSLPLRLIAICIGLLLIVPTWTKMIVLIITTAGLFTALNATLSDLKQAPFFKLIQISDDEWILTKLRLQKRLVYPIVTLLIIIAIFS